jgi:hypothetical protein
MPVDHIFLGVPGDATTVSRGWCEFASRGQGLSTITCVAIVDEMGRRTTVGVTFNTTPRQ